jgi:hypothetical protein
MRADSGDGPSDEPDELTATGDAEGPVVATGVELVTEGGTSLDGDGFADGTGFAAGGSTGGLGGGVIRDATDSGVRSEETGGGAAAGAGGEASARKRSAKLGFSGRAVA